MKAARSTPAIEGRCTLCPRVSPRQRCLCGSPLSLVLHFDTLGTFRVEVPIPLTCWTRVSATEQPIVTEEKVRWRGREIEIAEDDERMALVIEVLERAFVECLGVACA